MRYLVGSGADEGESFEREQAYAGFEFFEEALDYAQQRAKKGEGYMDRITREFHGWEYVEHPAIKPFVAGSHADDVGKAVGVAYIQFDSRTGKPVQAVLQIVLNASEDHEQFGS